MTDRDIVDRLRSWSGRKPNTPAGECHEAADEIERLRARVAELEADSARLRVLAVEPFCDQYGDIDLHEQASIYASALGREEANGDDYMAALRDAIDVFRTSPMKEESR